MDQQRDEAWKLFQALADLLRKGGQPAFALVHLGENGTVDTLVRCNPGQEAALTFAMRLLDQTLMTQFMAMSTRPAGTVNS